MIRYVLASAEKDLEGKVNGTTLQRTASATDFDADYHGPASAGVGSPPTQPGATSSGPAGAFWTVDYYSKWFDVDSDEVGRRLLASVLPRGGFLASLSPTPDLYGPFWVPTTVVFCLFVTSSIAGSIFAYLHGTTYNYDLTMLTVATTTVYAYLMGLPGFLWGVGKWFKSPVKFLEVLAVVGYSFTIWVPTLLLCILPMELARWILIGIAFGVSAFFILQNVLPALAEAENPLARTLAVAAVSLGHAGLALLFRLYFFRFIADVSKPPSAGVPATP
ncbi:hypothetical protein HDU96_010085, partial [Phlyctochytrium bullatum]